MANGSSPEQWDSDLDSEPLVHWLDNSFPAEPKLVNVGASDPRQTEINTQGLGFAIGQGVEVVNSLPGRLPQLHSHSG